MQKSDFFFDLPRDLIAQYPSQKRGDDRLMLLNRRGKAISHHMMSDLPQLLDDGTLMIFNNSKVRRARVFAIKESSGKETEFLFLKSLSIQGEQDGAVWLTMARASRKQKAGNRYKFPDGTVASLIDLPEYRKTEFRALRFAAPIAEDWFNLNGHIPLPPYIKRRDTQEDSFRYQNVYAEKVGSVACPTAGLHFTESLLKKIDNLANRGIERDFITLHVGLGTFLPVREDEIEKHTMHEEVCTISQSCADKINKAKQDHRPILAVGTTSVRTLESFCVTQDSVKSGTASTRIFIYPGYKFKIVDQIFTNFHTPESTLLMLVSAFAGTDTILNAYKLAIEHDYHFFSYGDCMLIK